MGALEISTDFGQRDKETPAAQALRIFNALKARIEGSDKKVAILYSANDDQAQQLHGDYKKKSQILRPISGSGQALVFAELIKLINKENGLNGQIRILPIATSLHGGANGPHNFVSLEIIQRDLGAIKKHLDDGYDVLGIPKREDPRQYAIGGASSKFWSTQDYSAVQCKGKPISQGEFVQTQLNALTDGDSETFDRNFAEAIETPAEPLRTRLKYDHATDLEKKRFHGSRHLFSPATTDEFPRLKARYQELTGDHLKTKILSDFKQTLEGEGIRTPEDVKRAFETFKTSDEWKILQKSQGFTTAVLGFFHLKKTSSVLACEALVEEKKQSLTQEAPRLG